MSTARTALMRLLNQVEPGYLAHHFGDAYEIDTIADTLLVVHRAQVRPEVLNEAADAGALDRDAALAVPDRAAYIKGMNRVISLLRQMADAGQVATGSQPDTDNTAQPADFFKAGRTYTRQHHGNRIEFLVEHVATTPSGSHRIAFGWRNAFGWPEEPFDSDDLDGWTDATNGSDTTHTTPDYRAAVTEALRLLETAPEAFQAAPSQNITAAAHVLRQAHELGGGK